MLSFSYSWRRRLGLRVRKPRRRRRLRRQQRRRPITAKLAKSEGVLCPPAGIDPEIHAPTPPTGDTSVIPPPGSPGGNPNVKPK
jgi:hypothetical protein